MSHKMDTPARKLSCLSVMPTSPRLSYPSPCLSVLSRGQQTTATKETTNCFRQVVVSETVVSRVVSICKGLAKPYACIASMPWTGLDGGRVDSLSSLSHARHAQKHEMDGTPQINAAGKKARSKREEGSRGRTTGRDGWHAWVRTGVEAWKTSGEAIQIRPTGRGPWHGRGDDRVWCGSIVSCTAYVEAG